jgi:hypothetical protein
MHLNKFLKYSPTTMNEFKNKFYIKNKNKKKLEIIEEIKLFNDLYII